ncbi:MAG: choice-of-anchor D domain-containing protein [Bryobacteraceae bacterium]
MTTVRRGAGVILRLTLSLTGLLAAAITGRAATTLSFTPTLLNFPVTTTGSTSAALTTTVANTGAAVASFTSIVVSGNDAADFSISTKTCGATLAAGATCTVSATFKPVAGGIRQSAIVFTDDATGSPQSVTVQGTGQSATAGLGFNPTAIAFPATTVGATASAISTTVTNFAAASVTFTGVHLQGTNVADFSISGNGCTTLAQASTCYVSVTFTPLAVGVRQAYLAFADSATGSPQIVPIVGTAQSATQSISVSPANANFGTLNAGSTSNSTYFAFYNAGTAAVTMSSYSITGTNAADYTISSNTCPTPGALLNPGSTCYIYVTFTPSAAGVRTAALSVADTATGSPQTATLYGVGQAGTSGVSFSRGTMDLGVEPVNVASGQTYVGVQNTGTTPVTFTSVVLGGTNAADFAITSPGCSGSLAPLSLCYVYVNFKPLATGQRSATLTFTDSAAGSPQVVNLVGTGVNQTQTLAFTYLDYGFGAYVLGSSSNSFYVGVTNTGDVPVTFTAIATAGTNAADFAITSNGCPISPSVLNVGSTCYVYTNFSPSAAGVRSGSLQFTDSATGSPQTVGLGGLGLAPSQTLDISAPGLVFPTTTVNSSSGTQTVILTNTGDQAITFSSATVTGTNASSFAVTSNGCATLQPGSACYIYVNFTPQATGVLTASLSISDTAAGSPQTVALAGDGLPATLALSANPNNVNFGYGVTAVTSTATKVTMSNLSGSAVTVSLSVAGTNTGDFVVTSNTCSGTLAGSASCTLNVAFKPTSLGLRTAALRFTVGAVIQDVLVAGFGTSSTQLLSLEPAVDFGGVTVGSSSPQNAVTIQNTGGVPVNITGYSFAGTNPTEFSIASTTCAATLAPNGLCDVNLIFTPAAANARTASLMVADTATGSPQAVGLSGIGQPSLASLTLPSAVDLGSTVAGSPVSANVSVYNNGTVAVTVNKTAIAGTNASDFAVTYMPCSTINPENACNIQVTFNPTAAGVRTATLSVTDTATGSPQSVTLVGVAQISKATLNVASAVAFPSVLVASYNTQNLSLLNTGTITVTVTSAALSGANAADFTVFNACPSIPAASSCSLPIAFVPSAAGLRTATLTITDNATGSPQKVILTGYASALNATLSIPSALAFPTITVGQYLVKSVSIYNTGNTNVLFTSVKIAGTNPSDFQLFGTCPQLSAGQGCTLYVAFTPTTIGTRTATLQFTDNATGSPQSMTLTGIGQGKTTTASLTPSTLTFAAQTVGTQSGSQYVYLSNTGSAPLTVSKIAITGTNPVDFHVYANNCAGATLNPNTYCYAAITFTPTATGARSATVVATDNAVGGSQSAVLNGTGQ